MNIKEGKTEEKREKKEKEKVTLINGFITNKKLTIQVRIAQSKQLNRFLLNIRFFFFFFHLFLDTKIPILFIA